MATDCVVDGDYLGAYSRFFAEFVARVNPNDQLPVKVSAYDVDENELVGEIISVTLQYLNKTYCPPSLQSYIVHLVIQAIKSTCKKQPEICGLRQQEKTYAPLKLMQAVTNEVNEICRRYLDNSRLALLPPPSSTPQVTVGATRNARRKMEDRHMILHDLHTIFNIQDDTIVNYYAVFDGHGGQDAAAYCATHLHQYLIESVHYPTDPEAALRDAFLTTDAQFIAKSSTQKLNGGTTAVCALMLNKKLYIAWVGDSMASLVAHGNVKQLVNPHRPAREDENERIRNMGGVVVHCMGVLRVNGFLSISRAIGDVPYKPYVSGEPEVRCVSLDGTEDFLIIACDGLWDYVDQRTAALRVYRQVLQNPHDLKHVHQALLQSAKRAGSLDNITVIVVFLTPPVEIASRHSSLTHPAPNGLLLNSMDPNNPVSSNSGQFDVNAAFIKQQQQLIDADLHLDLDINRDLNRAIFGMARNGKHQDGDGNDDDYDYADLGPETDVDADEDAADNNRLSEALVTSSSSSREFAPEESPMETEADNKGDGKEEEEDLSRRDNANVCPVDSVINDVVSDDNRVRLSDRDVRCDERPRGNNDDDDDDDDDEGEARVESTTTTGTHTLVDDDESPPSPRVAKSLQHALIPEAENVADSEDSEDEWNYYRIDPNKKESATTAESSEDIEKQNTQDPESVLKGGSEVQSSKVEVDIKCEGSEEEIPSLKLVNIDISYQKEPSESEKKDHGEKQADDDKEDMDFQLNPEAAEFVPLSPPLLNNRNALQDYPISGSPLKQTPAMDDILIPSQSEFEKEVCLRPKEIDENFSSDEQQQQAARDNNLPDMDVSEISSTKAEVGDDSTARIASTTQWQTDISSQWSTTTRNDAGSDSEEYEIINRDNPMTMSFTPGDLEAAFEKGVDLNAVHDLNDSSDDAEHIITPPRSPGGPCVNENVRSYTPPLLDDKGSIDLLCASSTPHSADNQSLRSSGGPCASEDIRSYTPPSSDDEKEFVRGRPLMSSASIPWTRIATSKSDEAKDAVSVLKAESSPAEQLGVTLLADDSFTPELNTSPFDYSQSTDSSEVDNKSLLSSELNYAKSSLPEKSTPEDCGESVKLTEGSDKIQDEGEQMCLFGITGYRESTINEKLQDTAVELPKKMDPTKDSNADNSEMKQGIPDLYRFCSEPPANFFTFSETEREYENAEMSGKPLKQPIINSEETFYVENPKSQQSNWADFYKTDKSMLLGMDEDPKPDCNDIYDPWMKNRFASDLKKQDNNQPDKFEENDIVVKPDSTNPSDSMKEESTVAEKQIQPEGQTHQTDVSSACTLMTAAETEQKLIEIAVAQIREVCEKQQMASEDIPTSKEEETKPRETAKAASPEETKPRETAKAASPEDVAKTDESKEQITGTAEEETMVKAAVASTVKAKATTTATKRPTKTTSTTKVTATSTTKTATKITPTSPSKAIGTMTSRVTTTSSPAQSAIAKKSVAARPKQLTDGSTKVTASSSVGKVAGIKTTTSSNKTATTTTTATTMKTSISPRVATTKSRTTSSTTVASSSKLSTATTSTEKKSTINKVAAAKPASTKTTTARTTTLLVKSSPLTTAKTSTTSNVTSKPRSTSAGTTTKTSVTTSKQSTTGSTSSRPRTAPPTSGGAIKPRENSAKALITAKSPLIDKQSKETVNKQISRSSAVATSSSKTGSRAPASLVGSTAAKSRLLLGKSPGKSSENAISPIKKPSSLTPRAASKTASSTPGTKSAPLIESPKVVQNGIPESRVVDMTTRAAVITATSDKPEDDVPRKDASPVNVPTDNQLLVTID